MTDFSNNEYSLLNLSPEEKRAFSYLFNQADKDQLGVVTGENAVTFFERTKLSPNVLGQIWQIADTENRGLLTQPGFFMVLRLIGHYQAGREPSTELAFKSGPVPRFEGMPIPGTTTAGNVTASPTSAAFPPNVLQPQLSGQAPIRVPPLDPQKVQQYASLFERSGTQNGQLDGATAKAIFDRAGLPNEILGRIWALTDRSQRGSLDQAEFIVAMHLLTSFKSKAMTAVPNTLPPGLYEAAARRGAPPSRQGSMPAVIPRQTTGSSFGAIPRTQSPLARAPGFSTPPPPAMSAQTTGTPWLITPADKAKFDQFFVNIDKQGRGILSGEQAVTFFSDSRLPEETLAQIWDLADINSEGQLNRDEFAVAMYLIRQQRAPNPTPLPAFLPPALIPPAMRKQTQQTQSTAPAFDNANNTSGLSKSAADDLFGLDQPASPPRAAPVTAVLQPQGTGASVTRDPFGGSQPGSPGPSSPPRFQPTPQPASSMFKPFIPTSSFGASLASQNTGGSGTASTATRAVPPPASAMDDLLGDSETSTAETSKLTAETTEMANMTNQIGNLRTQMEQTQAKKSTAQAELTSTSAQKRDLEIRLQQFRSQYEQEVRAVKEVEQQLTASRDSTKKLNQEMAMLEGTFQDLQTQRQTVSQALQADQQENASLKQRISQLNAEVAQLKPEIEKLKLDARQHKGMVSINKKQLATNEAERDRLQTEKATLEREASEREEHERAALAAAATAATTATVAAPLAERVTSPISASNVSTPATTLSSTNPFMRKPSSEGPLDRAIASPAPTAFESGPNPSAFDAIFGPSASFSPNGQASSRTGTPPATSFIGRSIPPAPAAGMSDSIQSISSVGQPTPSATPPILEPVKDTPRSAEPPPPPASRQFSASQLPVVDLHQNPYGSETSSTRVVPPASRAGEEDAFRTETPTPHIPGSFDDVPSPAPEPSTAVPGSFPTDFWQAGSNDASESVPAVSTSVSKPTDDFDSAFAGFGESEKSRTIDHNDPFAPPVEATRSPPTTGINLEFPPIQNLEPEDDDDSDDESDRRFDDNFTVSSPSQHDANTASQSASSAVADTTSAISGASATAIPIERPSSALPPISAQTSPPTYEQSHNVTHGGHGERSSSNQFPPEFDGLLPSREDPTSPPPTEAPTDTHHEVHAVSSESDFASAAPSVVFHDAPTQHVSETVHEQAPTAAPKNAFDEFDEFDDLAESKEADHATANGTDFGFGGHAAEEFNPAFDSPAVSMTTTMASSQQTPVVGSRSLHHSESSNGLPQTQSTLSASSTFAGAGDTRDTTENAQHDWDAIFSGLDNSNVDTSLSGSADPWSTGAASASHAEESTPTALSPQAFTAQNPFPSLGRAITPGTEHDDPILKRLTSMGYPRQQALTALEKYDYDINRAVDHLSGV